LELKIRLEITNGQRDLKRMNMMQFRTIMDKSLKQHVFIVMLLEIVIFKMKIC